jgi:trk system potassium uptake protein TrkA
LNIIIAGCGKVGVTLASTLNEEGHDITIIDLNEKLLEDTCTNLDVMGVLGNAASYSVQQEAGIAKADVFIAVTNEDELNLLCCVMAKRHRDCHTIARVRNPIYYEEAEFLRDALGLSLITNPEQVSAAEIARVLRFPSASRIDTFAKGAVEIVRYRIEPKSPLDGLQLLDLHKKYPQAVLVCAVERDGEVIIPDGNFVLQGKDNISVCATPVQALKFFKSLGEDTRKVDSAMIIGGSKIAYYLSLKLLSMGIHVKIIERNQRRCQELSAALPDADIILADATNQNVLLEEGLENYESFVALTDLDEENIMLSLYAKSITDAKLVTKVKRSIFDHIVDQLEVGTIISPRSIMANEIIRYVRAIGNSMGSNVETLYKLLDDRVEAMEFLVREKSKVTDTPLASLAIRSQLLICCIKRGNTVFIPRGNDVIKVKDHVIVVTTDKGLDDVMDILG